VGVHALFVLETGILAGNGNAFAAYPKTPVEILENKGAFCAAANMESRPHKGSVLHLFVWTGLQTRPVGAKPRPYFEVGQKSGLPLIQS